MTGDPSLQRQAHLQATSPRGLLALAHWRLETAVDIKQRVPGTLDIPIQHLPPPLAWHKLNAWSEEASSSSFARLPPAANFEQATEAEEKFSGPGWMEKQPPELDRVKPDGQEGVPEGGGEGGG